MSVLDIRTSPPETTRSHQSHIEYINSKIDLQALCTEVSPPFNDPELLQSIANLLVELGPELDSYDTLISDETSARLITLIIRKIANKRRARFGKEQITTYLLQGGTSLNTEITREGLTQFVSKRAEVIKKALVVSDYVASGKSMEIFLLLLEKLGIESQAATISVLEAFYTYPTLIQSKLMYGSVGRAGLKLHQKAEYSGVSGLHRYAVLRLSRATRLPASVCLEAFLKMGQDEEKTLTLLNDKIASEELAPSEKDFSMERYAYPLIDKRATIDSIRKTRQSINTIADTFYRLIE